MLPPRLIADKPLPSSKPSKANSRSKSKFKSTIDTENTSEASSVSLVDRHDYSSQHIADYVADPVDPNPPYTYHTVGESIKGHTISMTAYLDDLDAVMAKRKG